MTRSSESLAMALLTNRIVDVGVKPLTAREFWKSFTDSAALDGILEMDVDQIASHLIVTPALAHRIRELLDASRALSFETERLEESGVRLLTPMDESFPHRLREKLGEQCPVSLLVAGPVEWLSEANVGIVGSRGVSEATSDAAGEIARSAVRGGFGVVSGLAKGIDQIAMHAAIEVGGRVCGAPTEGIRAVSRRPDVRAAVHEEALVLISPFGPDAPFSVGGAMGRNKLVYALSDLTVVVTSDEGSGGTWAGATEALEKGYGRVTVWEGPDVGPGNAALIKKGAGSVCDLADEAWLEDEPETAPAPAPEVVEVQKLF